MEADWLSQNKGERKWLMVEADVRGVGTRDEPLRTFAWEARVLWTWGSISCNIIDLSIHTLLSF